MIGKGCDGAYSVVRGATPHPRSGAEAGRTPCPRGSGQEELPHVRGQGQWPRVPGWDSTGTASEVKGVSRRSHPMPEAWGSSREELPHTRGQGRRPRGATPRPRSSGCVGTGGPREAIPRSRSGRVAVRRYPSFKVMSSSCALLEQP